MSEPPPTVAGLPSRLIDPDLVEASRVLRGALVRVHPSFRFEERLGRRLLDQAATAITADGGWARRRLVPPLPFPVPPPSPEALVVDPERRAVLALPHVGLPHLAELLPHGAARRALIGGAIASGVSLAGAAILARRRRRPARPTAAPAEAAAGEGAA